ncbi:hypothetical protein [Nonomuraea sp. NPDC050540]|uniref:hypothetical protein n=1 Tax=Nonomuraea sp. NPDC050540 TaxID=3364367 RepID=UPI0037A44A35
MTSREHHDADRLIGCQATQVDELAALLDIEAGLRAVLLHSQHTAQVKDLDTVLDIEAGLAAIMPATPPAPPEPEPEELSASAGPGQCPWPVSPQERLILRRDYRVLAASRSLDRADAFARALDGARARALALDLALAYDHDRALADDLVHARAQVRCLEGELDLAHDHDLAARARTQVRRLARALDLAYDPNRANARDIVRALALDLNHILARAHDLVRQFVTSTEHAVREVLGRDVCLQEETVRLFLDDFTAADLRTACLANLDLAGVRWSEMGTRWPPEVDIGELKTHSDTLDAARGLYVVREGWRVRDFADLS